MNVLGGHVSPHTASSSMVAILVMLMSRRKERDGIEIERERERERAERKWRNVPQGLGLPPGRYLELSTRKSLVGVCVLTKSKNSHVPPVNSFVAAEG